MDLSGLAGGGRGRPPGAKSRKKKLDRQDAASNVTSTKTKGIEDDAGAVGAKKKKKNKPKEQKALEAEDSQVIMIVWTGILHTMFVQIRVHLKGTLMSLL
jgi:hypothetical protein